MPISSLAMCRGRLGNLGRVLGRHLAWRLADDLRYGIGRRHGLVVERAYGAQVAHDAVRGPIVEGDGAGRYARPAVCEAVDQEPHHLAPGAAHLGGSPVQRLELAIGDPDVQAPRHGVTAQVGHPQGRRASPRRAKGRSDGSVAEASPRGTDESLSHRDGSRGHPVRSVCSVHPGHRGCAGWAT